MSGPRAGGLVGGRGVSRTDGEAEEFATHCAQQCSGEGLGICAISSHQVPVWFLLLIGQ